MNSDTQFSISDPEPQHPNSWTAVSPPRFDNLTIDPSLLTSMGHDGAVQNSPIGSTWNPTSLTNAHSHYPLSDLSRIGTERIDNERTSLHWQLDQPLNSGSVEYDQLDVDLDIPDDLDLQRYGTAAGT